MSEFIKNIRLPLIIIVTILFVLSPFKHPFTSEQNVAEAVGIGLIGGATTNSTFENGILAVEIHGGSALRIAIAKDYYAQIQLPSSLGHLLKDPKIRDHMKLKYSLPAPILGFIPIRGEVKGDHLIFDPTNNIASGTVNIPINLSLAGVYKFTFEIDMEALDETVPLDTYEFKINVGDEQLDLPLLEFPQSKTTLEFEHQGFDDGEGNGGSDGDGGSGGDEASHGSSEATVVFLPNDSAPPVVDPTEPEKPYEPDPADPTDPQDPPTENAGYLTLDYVSSINLGKHTIEGSTEVYESEELRPFIQVTDRRGTGSGWAVTAVASEFETDDDQDTLPGSILMFKNGSVISPGNSAAPYPYPDVELHPGGESDWVLWADQDTGLGTWVNRWFPSEENSDLNDHVLLEVPGGSATVGEHKATVTWLLTDAPGQ